LLAPPRESASRRSVDDYDRKEGKADEVPHEDGTEEENEEVDQKVIVPPHEAVDDAGNGDEGDRHHYGPEDEVMAVVLEVEDVETR